MRFIRLLSVEELTWTKKTFFCRLAVTASSLSANFFQSTEYLPFIDYPQKKPSINSKNASSHRCSTDHGTAFTHGVQQGIPDFRKRSVNQKGAAIHRIRLAMHFSRCPVVP
jgi:hypothetical protein